MRTGFIGSIGLILLGAIFLGGVFALFYQEERSSVHDGMFVLVSAPYQDIAVPLVIAGMVLLVVGFVGYTRAGMKHLKKGNRMLMGCIGTGFGLIFLAGALFCSLYFEHYRGPMIWDTVAPYQKYAAPLWIGAIILLVIGLDCLWRAGPSPRLRRDS